MAFNTWSASYALMHVLEGLHGSDQYDLAILDRGLFDALAWFELLAKRGDISAKDRDTVHGFLRLAKWRDAIDSVFLFRADPDTSLEREHMDKLIEEPGQAMNVAFLTELNEAYEEVEHRYAGEFKRFTNIDTGASNSTTPKSTAATVASAILAIFEADDGEPIS